VNGSIAGSPGLQWITWEFNVAGNDVSIYIEKPNKDRLLLINYDKTTPNVATTDGNISLFYADFFTSVAAPAGSTFGLIDNVLVSQIPEPTAGALGLLGTGVLLLIWRRK
jgi:hypothetical protein